MKKLTYILTVFTILTITSTANGQDTRTNAFGLSAGPANTGGYSINLDFNFYYLYASIGSNFKYGTGEQLDFSSSQTYTADKVNTVTLTLGPRFFIGNFRIVPYIGAAVTSKIYNDPIAFDTYYMGDAQSQTVYGGKIQYAVGDILLTAGAGSFQTFTLGIGGRF